MKKKTTKKRLSPQKAKLNKKNFDIEASPEMTSDQIALYLDERERKFAYEYLIDLNGTQAAIRAGYRPGKNNSSAAVQAARLIKDPVIIAYRRALLHDEIEAFDLTKDNVLLRFLDIADKCLTKKPVMEWSSEEHTYVPTGEWTFDSRGATSALTEICKLLGYYEPEKHDINATRIIFEGMDDVPD